MRKSYGISAVVLCFALLLAGCGGGGGGTAAPTGTTISGTVSAPSGVALGRSAGRSAAATGLVVKASVTVEAYLIDNSGNKSGSTLATATSNASGVYSLTLPVGTSAASNLVVVVGTGNNQMRNFVTATSVNIDPISETVVREIADGSNTLSQFSVTEIASILSDADNAAQPLDLSGATSIDNAVTTVLADSSVSSYIDNGISDSTKSTTFIVDMETHNLPLALGGGEKTIYFQATGDSTVTAVSVSGPTGSGVTNHVLYDDGQHIDGSSGDKKYSDFLVTPTNLNVGDEYTFTFSTSSGTTSMTRKVSGINTYCASSIAASGTSTTPTITWTPGQYADSQTLIFTLTSTYNGNAPSPSDWYSYWSELAGSASSQVYNDTSHTLSAGTSYEIYIMSYDFAGNVCWYRSSTSYTPQ